MKWIEAFFSRFFKRDAEPERQRASIIPGFLLDPETEVIVKNFAVLHSKLLHAILAGEKVVVFGEGISKKVEDISLLIQQQEDKHREQMRDYLKPYIEFWNVTQAPEPDEWHRWYVAGALRQEVKSEHNGPSTS